MATDKQSFYELYRQSSVGAALTDALDDLIMETRIDPQLAMKILANFDRAIAEVLQNQVRARLSFKVPSPAGDAPLPPTMLGSLDTYRFCDEVWTFQLKNVTFKMDSGGQVVSADKVKIVSCTAKPTGT
ncbi:transcription initiation factor IIA [Apiospora rasikravindrae]|uniref:Transcription initiation factor IIA subunit 2 n=1 Tax=Apiospora rasikravindrae TaxID=990691 RepID=A0ABR1U078_9PEZI